VGREGQGDFEFGSGLDGAVEVEENTARADVLSLGLDFLGWDFVGLSVAGLSLARVCEADDGREAHVKAPHHPPFL